MKQILCLSNEPWSSSPGRTQQLISRLRDVSKRPEAFDDLMSLRAKMKELGL